MTLDVFFSHFELLADQPDAVAKMRELVLQLAVQGKLVDQDSKDEPASKLLEQIQIQNQNRTAYHAVSAENAPYKAPTNWIWVKLGFLAEIERGGSPRPIKDYITDDPNGLNWIKIGDTEKGGKFITSTEEKIRKEGLKKTRKVYPGDFLLTNSMSFGRPYITKIEGCIHDGWLRIHPPRQITSDYLYCLLSSPFVYAFFSKAAAGAVVQNLNADKVRELPIPLPPLAEQRRIVAKVDELVALCDELEQRQQARQHASGLLQQSALHHLLAAREPVTFAGAWQRVRDHFHLLHDTPDAIPQLRQAILQLAVQGRLVPQNPKDVSVRLLLERVKAVRRDSPPTRTKVANDKTSAPQVQTLPFIMPTGWEEVRLGEVFELLNGCAFRSEDHVSDSQHQVIRLGNVKNQRILLDQNPAFIPDSVARESEEFLIRENDLLITMTGTKAKRDYAFTALVAKADLATTRLYLNQRVGILRAYVPEVAPLANVFLKADGLLDILFQDASGTANQGNISAVAIRNLPFPLPPLAEQKRIVARVEELLRWCATLEAQLHQTRTLGAHLLDSTLHHLLAA